jgi:hypothetical protein
VPKKSELRIDAPSFEAKGFLIKRLRDGKIILKSEEANYHLTVHPGGESGKLDVHRTREDLPDGHPGKHERLFSVALTDIPTILTQAGDGVVDELRSLLRPITIGWIARQHLTFIGSTVAKEPHQNITSIRFKRGPVDETQLARWVNVPEFLDDIDRTPGSAGYLFDCSRGRPKLYGLLFAVRTPEGASRLRWVKVSELLRFSRQFERRLLAAYRNVTGDATGPAPLARAD